VLASDYDHESARRYYEQVLLAPPPMPADLDMPGLDCSLEQVEDRTDYRSAAEVDYGRPGWESRVAADWDYVSSPSPAAWFTLIDIRREPDGLAYRYLANDRQQNRLYEPWSSSKVMAYTAAMASLRRHGLGADSLVGGMAVADLVTSVHSYEPFGTASGSSNEIATYFLNLAGRDYATALFHDAWLRLADPAVRFRGAYGPEPIVPDSNEFLAADGTRRHTPAVFAASADDPHYQSYRCEGCGLTGNKPMSALAQAEWLKRLAVHRRDPLTRHPRLETIDIEALFFGRGHRDAEQAVGGMLLGISQTLHRALAGVLAGQASSSPGATLDALTDGRWRIYQKVGWGPSETRGTSEFVLLAHVCLPGLQGRGREFTLAGRAAVDGNDADETRVGAAGRDLELLLELALQRLLR
jgi:hypothetical protein